MSYAKFASPLPAVCIPVLTISRSLRVALAIVGTAVQCIAVAAVLWVVLAAPGLLTDQNSAKAGIMLAQHR